MLSGMVGGDRLAGQLLPPSDIGVARLRQRGQHRRRHEESQGAKAKSAEFAMPPTSSNS